MINAETARQICLKCEAPEITCEQPSPYTCEYYRLVGPYREFTYTPNDVVGCKEIPEGYLGIEEISHKANKVLKEYGIYDTDWS